MTSEKKITDNDQTDGRTAVADPFSLQTVIYGCMGNMAVVGAVLSEFERQLAEDSQRIHANLKNRDAEAVRVAAHKLKGAAGIFSAHAIWSVASEIEELAQDGRLDATEPLSMRLRTEVDRCLDHMPAAKAELFEIVGRSAVRRAG